MNKNKPYVNETVRLDGQHFEGCRFSGCEILYGGTADVRLVANEFIGCTWTLVDAASQTLDFLGKMQAAGGHALVQQILGRYGLAALPPADGVGDGQPMH